MKFRHILFVVAFTACPLIVSHARGVEQNKSIYLIVRGDDIGSCHAANVACIRSYKEGVMKSVELMVPCAWFPEAVKMLNENPGLDVGVHVALTSEWENIKWRPLTWAPSLTDADGYFYPTLWRRKGAPDGTALREAKWKIEDVEKEMRAQIEMAKRKVPHVSHMTCHMGCSGWDPKVQALWKKLAKEYDLTILPSSRKVQSMGGFGEAKTAQDRIEKFIKNLEGLKPGTYLFVDHPGLETAEMGAIGHVGYENVAEDRDAVTAVFTSDKVKQAIDQLGIKLISYADLNRPASSASISKTYDVVIYGGASAAVAAAVQAKRMGKTVIIVCPERHLGGLTAGGLGWTDSGRKEAIGGISREFYQRVKNHYDTPNAWIFQKSEDYSRYRPDDDAMWVFEPHVAEQTFEQLVAEYDIPVHRDQWLDRKKGVKKDGSRIISITMRSGKTYRGKLFIDATYEGDLMAGTGISYHVGREGNDVYGETLNGVQTKNATKHQFEKPVDPYITPGEPSSGLLPRIHAGSPGQEGQGDHRVQAYNYRMCLTKVPENRVPFPKPDHYDPMEYELLARYLDKGWRAIFAKFDPAPNAKTDTNNHGAFSTDNIGMNYDYPEASYERRQQILKEHQDYQKGLMWFLAYDPRVPADVREKVSQWGLAKDEFKDNAHWPHQIYVREARRMVSDFVMTELHLRKIKPTPKPVGMGSYNMDSHNVQRYVDENGHARNEGDIQINPGGPYPISYEALVPKASECTNLFVPVCLSSSHIAYGSIRMEPVFMILGQSAATAAAFAIDENIDVQNVDYAKLRKRLLADGQVLELR
ncbi:MAG: FAD-dependent oxidoreductase [Sedimentisphaerales bacterium]|nr:FAD-dependent oxidoreductase [Sedimentisphaerales bacterium]